MAKKLENETELGLKRRARKINRELAQAYPYAVPELDFETPFELLVATVLSAQTTDVRVNAITPALFARFPNALAMSQAERAELEQLIRPPASSAPRPIPCSGYPLRWWNASTATCQPSSTSW